MKRILPDLVFLLCALAIHVLSGRSLEPGLWRLAVFGSLAIVAHVLRRPGWAHGCMFGLLVFEVVGYVMNPVRRSAYFSLLVPSLLPFGGVVFALSTLERGRLRLALARFGWCAFLLGVGLAGAEWIARRHEPRSFHEIVAVPGSSVATLYAKDPHLGHRMRPNFRGRFRHPEFRGERFETNERGFRDAPWVEKEGEPTSRRRVLLLGDSLVVGLGLEREEALPAQLEERLREGMGVEVRVRSLAVAGYGPAHYRHLLQEHVPAWPAELVIACFYDGNDLEDASHVRFREGEPAIPDLDGLPARRRIDLTMPLPLWTRTYWYRASALARRFEMTFAPTFASWGWPPPDWVFNHEFVHSMAKRPDRVTRAQYVRVERAFVAMAEHCGTYRARFLLVRLPAKLQVERGSCEALLEHLGLDPEAFDPTRPGSEVLRTAEGYGIETLDALPILVHPRVHGSPHYFFEGHLSRRGVQVVADVLAARARRILERDGG